MATVINSAFIAEIIAQGGRSFNFTNNEEINPVKGYMVSLPNTELVVPKEKFSADLLSHFYTSNFLKGNLKSEHSYCGVWVSGNNVYIDVSINKFDLEQTIIAAIFRNQIAIFDVENESIIRLPKCQTAGTDTQKKAYAQQVADKIISEVKPQQTLHNYA